MFTTVDLLPIMHHRRLVRDYETRPDNSTSTITLTMIDNLSPHTSPRLRSEQILLAKGCW